MKSLYQFDLTPLVLDYQSGKIDEETVLNQCSLFVFWKLQKDPRLDEDVRQDFFLAFLRYVKKSLVTFCYQGIPFERYLLAVMKKRIISFHRSCRRERLYWRIASDASFAPAYRAEEAAGWPLLERTASLLRIDGADGPAKPLHRKWFLVWMLKHNRFMADDDIRTVARLSGRDERWVADRVACLRAGTAFRERRLAVLRRRRNRLFVTARVLELRVREEPESEARQTWSARLERKRRSLRNVIHIISRVGLYPSHRQIARATGIPKGTVDSIIARLKKMLVAETVRPTVRIA